MIRDLRHGFRVLFQARGWTAVIVVSLALGIGANTALFSVINGLLLTTLPVKDPDSLVRFRYAGRNDMVTSSSGYGFLNKTPEGQDVRASFSYPMFQQFVADNRTMDGLFACAPFGRVNVVVDGHAEIATAFISTGNYYQVLGVTARPGRTIVPDDDRPTAPPVATISAKYWHSRFGSDPAVVGKVVSINNVPITIVGVIAPDFTGIQQPLGESPDVSLPLALDPQFADPQLNNGSRPPRLAARPALQLARPAAALGALATGTRAGGVSRSAQEGLKLASETVQQGSRSSRLGTLALAAAVGFIISRKR